MSLWKDFDVRFDGILQRIKESGDLLGTTAEKQRHHLRRAAQWLTADDIVQDLRLERQTQKSDELIKWVQTRPEMISWESDNDESPVIWLHGRKAGKRLRSSFHLSDSSSAQVKQ